jgi:hypothetical protein
MPAVALCRTSSEFILVMVATMRVALKYSSTTVATKNANQGAVHCDAAIECPLSMRAIADGDRIAMLFAALHVSVPGTFEPWADVRSTTIEGNSDIEATSPNDRL